MEYHSPYPVEIPYRGHKEKNFKRDFAKEFWNKYPECSLVDYGFFWSKGRFPLGR